MENKPAQNIQDTFLNTIRKDKTPITIYLVSGVKLTGKIRSFDKYSVLLENNSQEQLIFKHAISTVVSNRGVMHTEHRPSAMANRHWSGFSQHAVGVSSDCGAGIAGGSGLDWQWSRAGPAERVASRNARSWWEWTLGSARAATVPAWRVRGRLRCAWKNMRRNPPRLTNLHSSIFSQALPGLDAEESLAEFRELVSSAGGVVAAELLQHRSRPDPATSDRLRQGGGDCRGSRFNPGRSGALRPRPLAHAIAQS